MSFKLSKWYSPLPPMTPISTVVGACRSACIARTRCAALTVVILVGLRCHRALARWVCKSWGRMTNTSSTMELRNLMGSNEDPAQLCKRENGRVGVKFWKMQLSQEIDLVEMVYYTR